MRQIFFWRCLIGMLSAVILTGCGFNESLVQSGRAAAAGDVLFEDDFAQVANTWGVWDRSGGDVRYEQGGLRIYVKAENQEFWSVAGQRFRDVILEGDARRIGGPADNIFGLICRYQDAQNFYAFLASSDGYYGIAKRENGQHSLIGAEQLQYSGMIDPDQLSHHLRAECNENTLRFWIDGVALFETRDSTFETGDVGLLAGTYSKPGVDILFDNFRVKQP